MMTKNYLVAGANWSSQVEIENSESYTDTSIQIEAATRAIEAKLGKRNDINIIHHEPISLTDEQKEQDPLHASLVGLLTDELEIGCGIGMLLCIMDTQNTDTYDSDEPHEWYISSKSVLENMSNQSLVNVFDKKYPNLKKDKSV